MTSLPVCTDEQTDDRAELVHFILRTDTFHHSFILFHSLQGESKGTDHYDGRFPIPYTPAKEKSDHG